ncbi:TilS substrate-binding domain-containing protein [Arthrobacter psychrolactophilus]
MARSANILGHDADYLDELAGLEYEKMALRGASSQGGNDAGNSTENGADGRGEPEISLSEDELRGLAPALRMRVLALAVVELGGVQPSLERLASAEKLLERKGSAGPVQLAGKVSAWRISRNQAVPHEGLSYGKLVLRRSR